MNKKRSRNHERPVRRLLSARFFATLAVIVIFLTTCCGETETVGAVAIDTQSRRGELQSEDMDYCYDGDPANLCVTETSRYASIELTEEEIDLLARIIWLEARGECFEGQQAVAEVVFNRMLSEYFPDTLHDVIYGENQFATAGDVHNADPDSAQYEAIENALNGPNILPLEVVFFSVGPQNDNIWGSIGGHVFCYPWFWDGTNE